MLEKIKNNQPLTKAELEELTEKEKKNKQRKGAKKPRSGDKDSPLAGGLNSQKAAAKYAKVNTRTIRRWVQAGMPTGKLDGKTIYIAEMLDFYKLNEGSQTSGDRKREQKAQADYKTTKAQLLELELKIKQGELIERDSIEKERILRILTVKRALLGLGRTLAPQLATIKNPRKIQSRIDKEVRTIIEKFAKS